MSQFEPTGEKIAQEIALEGYGDPEKARMRAALEAIQAVTVRVAVMWSRSGQPAFGGALNEIYQLARQGLAP